MTRSQLEHVIRAAATIAGDTEIVVVGSQAMLGRYPDAPPEMLAWEARLVRVETPAGVGLCLEPHDLVLSKYVAGREKDRDYVRAAARHELVDRATLLTRLHEVAIEPERIARIQQLIEADFRAAAPTA
jgi:hypothetical protein